MGLLSQHYPNIDDRKDVIFDFLRRNRILGIKPQDVNQQKVQEMFNELKILRQQNKWTAGDNDLEIISINYVAGMDCISTNNTRDFIPPCNHLQLPLEFPPIIQIGSRQDVDRMLKSISKNHPFKTKRRRR